MLYVILVFIISTILIKIDSALWINVFEVMITAYFTIIYEICKEVTNTEKENHNIQELNKKIHHCQ